MSPKHIATARWRALDREGHDTCRLSQTTEGWMLSGHAEFRDDLGRASLNYVVRCDLGWLTQSVDLAGRHGTREVQSKIVRYDSVWYVDDIPQTDVARARDIDLSFTPATNLMPLRRLETRLTVTAAWLRYPSATLSRLDQVYAREDGRVGYSAEQTGFSTTLDVDPSGFVLLYPDLWHGEVTHAA